MVKRILSVVIIIVVVATSLVPSCLHRQEIKKPYMMYQEPGQYENGIYYNTVEPELSVLAHHGRELSMKEVNNKKNTIVKGDTAVAGVSVLIAKTKYVAKEKVKVYKHEVTKVEKEMLQRITEAEATGGDVESKKNIVSTILNRVESNSFPSSIEKVIFQKSDGVYQFSPVKDRRYFDLETSEETKQAVEEVLLDGVTHECLYFFSIKDVKSAKTKRWIDNKLEYVLKDDVGHSFYKEK